MVYIRNDITSRLLSSEPCLEGIFFELRLRNKRWLLFAGYNYQKSNIINYLNKLGRQLDKYLGKYDNVLLIGDFNSEITETNMDEFCNIYNLKSLIKENTCFKNPSNPSCIDLMLTNRSRSFIGSQTVELGVSDFHKMTVTVLKA